MKVYIQSKSNGKPSTYNFFIAYQGFLEMGFETICFWEREQLSFDKRDLLVGYVNTIRGYLGEMDIFTPDIDYPPELTRYLGRKVWQCPISVVRDQPETWPVFIKPVRDKQFTGVVVRSTKDLIGCGIQNINQEIYCSEVVDFQSEWRCFIRYGKILDVRLYRGDWRIPPSPTIIENAIKAYTSAPAGCCLDFGVTKEGRTLLIEVNDGYSLSNYGLFYTEYAKLLSARWAELADTVDECFIEQ